MEDNPYLTQINPDYIKNASKKWHGVFYKRNVLSEWALADGLIYPHFSDEHIINTLPDSFDKIFVGVDYGTTHPTVFLLIGVKDNIIYVMKEYYAKGRLNSQLASDFVNFIDGYNINGITVDSAAASFIQELRSKNIHVKDCVKDVQDGISKVSSLLGENKILIYKDCKNTIKEFYTYSWDTKKSESNGKDVVIKLNDDCMDTLRYVIMTFLNKKAIEGVNRNIFGF